jgi:PAS domain S-box-containing protein
VEQALLEQRVLILAPIGQDGQLTASFLTKAGIDAAVCSGMVDLSVRVQEGCAAVLVAEEALETEAVERLTRSLDRQPSWSELPVAIITSTGNSAATSLQRLTAFGPRVNITLLERPFRPITLVNTIRAALRSRRRQYQVRDLLEEREMVLASINDAFVTFDTIWRCTFVNDRAAELIGRQRKDLLGQNVWELFPVLRSNPVHKEMLRAMSEQQIVRFEFFHEKKGRWLDLRLYPSPKALSILGTDVTEQKEAQRALSRSNEELERRVTERTAELTDTNDQLEAFVYTIAHDLRAPLRAMQAFSSLLLKDYASSLDATAQNYAQRIVRAAELMDRLVIDLLAYGRMARAELAIAPVDVEGAWKSAVAQCENDIAQKQASLEAAQPMPKVMAHEVTLGQVLANLLSNALKFSKPGTAPHVKFGTEVNGKVTRMWVEDNGIGIAPEHQERVFRIFERLNGSTYSGTGIGLSIVRKGVERMNGRVGVTSAPGQGSRFWIELPKP